MRIKFLVLGILLLTGSVLCGCGGKLNTESTKEYRMLSGFENIKLWDISPEKGFTLSLSKRYVTEGKYSLKVVYPVSTWPSINTKRLNHNWGNYGYFCFDVYNPQNEEVKFTVRLDDNRRRRVNIKFSLKNGWNYIKIPKSRIARRINADDISFVVLFLNHPQKRITLYFDNMRLEPDRREKMNKKQFSKKNSSIDKSKLISVTQPIKETFGPIVIKSNMPKKGELEVPIVKFADRNVSNVLVSTGIPFAPGQLFSERNFAIFDKSGKEIPIAVKVLARWVYDNSIRSLLVQFPFVIEYKYERVIIKWGCRRNTKDRKIVKVNWVLPQAYIVLPAEWLCNSLVIGEQVPVEYDRLRRQPVSKYDRNMEIYFSKLRKVPWSNDVRKDGYYSTPHVFYQFYVRTGEEKYFEAARRELVHYRDEELILEGKDRGRAMVSPNPRYIYVQAMVDDYLLTGDEKSLVVAGYMAQYLKNNFAPSKAFFSAHSEHFWTERRQAFPFLGIITYYELTGNKEYLKIAQQFMQNLYRTQLQWPDRGGFIHNLYSHDPEEGCQPDEYGGSPFMTGLLLEAIIKYHRITNSNIAKDSIFRALDWLMKEGLAPDGKSFVYLTCDKYRDSGCPDLNLLIAHAFGYGYKISGFKRRDYLEVGKRIFEYGVNNAYLGNRKHFNQNYRSSGHFLAYITEE
ncbi:MAG: hypothetical protein DRP76_00705 [Candidatus Omnitrophota bacterium]|nr:MAG: hypothetical protein DRP76_00705 [Candidatus Omnitrophota bacterium]